MTIQELNSAFICVYRKVVQVFLLCANLLGSARTNWENNIVVLVLNFEVYLSLYKIKRVNNILILSS